MRRTFIINGRRGDELCNSCVDDRFTWSVFEFLLYIVYIDTFSIGISKSLEIRLFTLPNDLLFCPIFLTCHAFDLTLSNNFPLNLLNANLWTFSSLLYIYIYSLNLCNLILLFVELYFYVNGRRRDELCNS